MFHRTGSTRFIARAANCTKDFNYKSQFRSYIKIHVYSDGISVTSDLHILKFEHDSRLNAVTAEVVKIILHVHFYRFKRIKAYVHAWTYVTVMHRYIRVLKNNCTGWHPDSLVTREIHVPLVLTVFDGRLRNFPARFFQPTPRLPATPRFSR